MLILELYLPVRASWKTPSPYPSTGTGRLMNAGCKNSTVPGGSGASKMLSVVHPDCDENGWCAALGTCTMVGGFLEVLHSGLRVIVASGQITFEDSLYLPSNEGWKTPTPDPNTGPGRLMNAGWKVWTVMGGFGASVVLSFERPGCREDVFREC